MSANLVDKQDWTAFAWSRPAVAPRRQSKNGGNEIASGLGQTISVSRRSRLVSHAFDNAAGNQGFEPPRQKIARYAKVFDEFIEPRNIQEQVTNDEGRPPVADQFEAAGQ
jgi:hypothetical protein